LWAIRTISPSRGAVSIGLHSEVIEAVPFRIALATGCRRIAVDTLILAVAKVVRAGYEPATAITGPAIALSAIILTVVIFIILNVRH
jgi:hypothetical protein